VVMNTSKNGRWLDSQKLLEYGFENFAWEQLVQDNQVIQSVPISRQDINQPDSIELYVDQGFGSTFSREEIPRIKRTVNIAEELIDPQTDSSGLKATGNEKAVLAPLVKGQVVGEVIFSLDEQEIFRTDLLAGADVAAMPWWRKVILPGLLSMGLGFPAVIAINLQRRRRRQRYIFKSSSRRIGL